MIDEAGRSWIRLICPTHGVMIPNENNPSRCRFCWKKGPLRDIAVASDNTLQRLRRIQREVKPTYLLPHRYP